MVTITTKLQKEKMNNLVGVNKFNLYKIGFINFIPLKDKP